MKCINKKLICFICTFLVAASAGAGCGKTTAELEQPYDIFQTTVDLGIIPPPFAGEKQFFADDLCVSEDVSIGTDQTNSQVAEAAATFNLDTGNVVYAKNMYETLYPASTTKILTAYLTIKYAEDLNKKVTVSKYAATQEADSSVAGLVEGDIMTVKDLLYGMMLRSGNDAAIALAEHISGDEAAFAELMNQEAKALGATHSHFVNPNGLPDPEHYTCVYDLYLIFNEALKQDLFVDLISTKSYDTFYTNAAGEEIQRTWENTNQYLTGHSKAPEGITVIGGKTGTTGEAGFCLALYSQNEAGQPIISIVLKADCKANLYLLMNEMLQGYAA